MTKPNKTSFFRRGGWRMLLCALLLCAIVLSGLLFDSVGARARLDLTRNGVFTLSDATLELLNGLESDVSLYVVEETGSSDMRLKELAERYDAASDNITADVITAANAAYYTGTELSAGTVIVANEQYHVVLEYTDLYEMEYSTQGYYQTLTDYSLKAEDSINGAIISVNADLPIAYYLSGHGETAAEAGVQAILTDSGYHTRALYLSELKTVPEDCALIICNAPQIDLTETEADLLIDYIDNGGSFFLVTDMKYPFGSQLARVAEHAGLHISAGIIMEGDAGYMFGADYPYYLLPEVNAEVLMQFAPDAPIPHNALIAVAHAIETKENADFEHYSIMKTSASAYIKPDAYVDGVIEYVEGDVTGPFSVAVAAENDMGGKVFWLAGLQCLGDAIDEMAGGANYACACAVVQWMHGDLPLPEAEEVAPVGIMTPPLMMDDPLAFVALCAAVPAVILIFGAIMCAKRHKGSVSENKK